MTSEPLALHRVDGKYLEGSHARMVAGTYEQRPMPIDVAKPDDHDLRGQQYDDAEDAGIDWVIGGMLVCFFAVMSFGAYIIF